MQLTFQQRQRILLACVAVLVVAAVAIFVLYPKWQASQTPGEAPQGRTHPTSQEEIDEILRSLAPPAGTPQPTQEEVDEILESLAPPPDTEQPTQEEIDAILESLRPQ